MRSNFFSIAVQAEVALKNLWTQSWTTYESGDDHSPSPDSIILGLMFPQGAQIKKFNSSVNVTLVHLCNDVAASQPQTWTAAVTVAGSGENQINQID